MANNRTVHDSCHYLWNGLRDMRLDTPSSGVPTIGDDIPVLLTTARTDARFSMSTFLISWLPAAVALIFLASCRADPPAVTTNLRLADEQPWRVLSQQQQRTVRRTMTALAASHEPSPPPAESDEDRSQTLRLAVEQAANRLEMALIRAETQDSETLYRLRTIHDRPVWLWIDHSHWPTIRAAATIGWIVDHGPLESQLLDVLDEALNQSLDVDATVTRMPARNRRRPAR